MNWVAKLVKNVEDMVNGYKVLDAWDFWQLSDSRFRKLIHGEDSGDNFVHIPSLEMIKSERVHDFEKRLGEGLVAVVEEVLDESSFHSCDPKVLWKHIVEILEEKSKEEDSLVNAIDCLDGLEVCFACLTVISIFVMAGEVTH